MCKRKLLASFRSTTTAILIVTCFTFVIVNMNREKVQTVWSSNYVPLENLVVRNYTPYKVQVVHIIKRFVQSSPSSTTNRKMPPCPDEIRTGYCVIRNFFSANMSVGYSDSVTLTTQGTIQFLKHAEELCKRWQGPVSVAIYAPGDDFQQVRKEIERLRYCRNSCVRNWVTWHMVFDADHQPPSELLNPSKRTSVPVHCGDLNPQGTTSYVDNHKLVYPINVARNVARLTAKTYYVFASDIELYPSQDIVPMFLKMVQRLKSDAKGINGLSMNRRHVFVLRVFEVHETVDPVPSTKEELVKLYRKNLAVFFHRYMCYTCHRIPNLEEWMRTKPIKDELTISMTTKRELRYKLNAWEPFFIGTNDDPLFDERLTWNGKANKMQVAFELCLMDYDLHILDDAFLVHIPGIKKFSFQKQKPRVPYMRKNKAMFRIITQELYKKYGNNTQCVP